MIIRIELSEKRIDSIMNIKKTPISEVIQHQNNVDLITQKRYSLNKKEK